jgi:hypothetical protein
MELEELKNESQVNDKREAGAVLGQGKATITLTKDPISTTEKSSFNYVEEG